MPPITKMSFRLSPKMAWSDTMCLYMLQYGPGDDLSVGTSVSMQKIKQGECFTHLPLAELSIGQAQELMDELWRCGIRPSEGKGSAGSLAATERHLEDMRQIAFGKLKIAYSRKPAGPGG